MVASEKITQELYNEYSDAFTGIGCFKVTFLLQVKEGIKQYQAPPSHMAYALQELLRK